MDEFDVDSYARAQALADRVFNYANSIHDVFDDIEGLNAYQVHPEHVKVADECVRPFTELRLCMDYEE